jgi:hypothetical protein
MLLVSPGVILYLQFPGPTGAFIDVLIPSRPFLAGTCNFDSLTLLLLSRCLAHLSAVHAGGNRTVSGSMNANTCLVEEEL